MRKFITDIDRLLRGGFTRPEDLKAGNLSMPAKGLALGGLILGCIYGVFMGLYGATRPETSDFMQLLATTLKVPLLFLLTLTITFPSLYVFSALAGSRLQFQQTLRLLLAAVAINLALLASLGPVVGFFTLSTQSYPFMIVLNVIIFGASGLAGLVFLRRALVHVFASKEEVPALAPTPEPQPDPSQTDVAGDDSEGPAEVAFVAPIHSEPIRFGPPGHAKPTSEPGLLVFRGWLVVYGVVGAQMGWVLRPFIGSPELPFTWFRERESNFLQGVIDALVNLFS